ncbi:MAG: ABC transporter ATP-binding protein [Planctomycetes bacterium]|nr:ABC transporter ATP-binding protein [Planctomycetota bacterium]
MATSISRPAAPHQNAAHRGARAESVSGIHLAGVGLEFRLYHDKSLSLKRAAINWVFRRRRQVEPAPSPQHPALSRRGQLWALRDIHLEIGPGERVGVIGPNGAGKTTLLKLIARIYPPTVGRLWVRGRVAPLLELGAAFHPELSARENISLQGALFGFSRRAMAARTPGILDFAELAPFADMPVKYFSSGMVARLGFSIATDVEPEILLVDEVFAIGDAAFRQKATQRMRALMDRSKIVLMASHDLELVAQLCSRVLLIQGGRIAADGAPGTVLEIYRRDVGPG